jgi:nucleoside-diphosphate-sugar epimerase
MINNIARLVNDIQPKKFVNISSACIYPKTATNQISENKIGGTDFHSSIQYSAMTKNWLLQVTEKLNVPWEYLILSNVYGPGEHLSFDRSHFIGSLVNKINNSTDILDMLGDGSSVRDFIYITDTAEAICRYCELETATNSVSNISTGHGSKINEIVEQLINISQRNLTVNWGDPSDNGVLYKVLDNRKMQQDINYRPQTELVEGLTAMWNWIQST